MVRLCAGSFEFWQAIDRVCGQHPGGTVLKKIGFGIVALLLITIGFVWVKYVIPLQSAADRFGPDSVARDYALQDDGRVTAPTAAPAAYAELHDPDMRRYWGELHVHTAESFDALLFGTTLGIEDAYRFAKGEPLTTPGGEVMHLAVRWILSPSPSCRGLRHSYIVMTLTYR